MVRVVIDTNVFYDGLLMNGASFGLLLTITWKVDF